MTGSEELPALDAQLFTTVAPLSLAGSTCTGCRTTTFPAQLDCPRCALRTMEQIELPRTGTLWTWTVQTFEPKAPYVAPESGFVPFTVGYVDLGSVVVESVILVEPNDVTVGMTLELTPNIVRGTDGHDATGFAFRAPTPEERTAP